VYFLQGYEGSGKKTVFMYPILTVLSLLPLHSAAGSQVSMGNHSASEMAGLP